MRDLKKGHIDLAVTHWDHQKKEEVQHPTAVEVPVALVYNDVPYTVVMMTPMDLEDFALGFSLTEGIISTPEELLAVNVEEVEDGFLLQMFISKERLMRVSERERSMIVRTGCSLCGVKELQEAVRDLPVLENDLKVPASSVYKSYEDLHGLQPEKKITGALHSAAFVNPAGNIKIVKEDVGRHNALDKMIGAALKAGINPKSGFVLITSRCSFEMVQKTVLFGSPVLAAISAPTTLAIDLAEKAKLTLLGLARQETFKAFTHIERIQ